MNILCICDHLPTFILNEILKLKEVKNEMFIWANNIDGVKGKPIGHKFSPILIKHGLFDKTFCRVSIKDRKKKLIYLVKNLVYDFSHYPIIAIKSLGYFLINYPNFKIQNYLDMRNFFGFKIDIIHTPFSSPHMLDMVYFLSKTLNVPYTLTFRAHDIYKGANLRKTKNKINVLREASQIITISKFNKDYIEKNININKDIKIIHSSLCLEFFKPDVILRSSNSITAVCRLTEEKGIIYLIQACHILNQRKIEYEVTIIGDGPERIKCENLINELQIPNINFIGYLPHDEIKTYLNHSTVFVLPCIITSSGLGDILPNALKEAMAMKVPVIASNMRGIEELVANGINGIIVPSKDPKSLADAIEKVFQDTNFTKTMGNAGRNTIEKDFNLDIEVGKLENIFKNAVRN